MGSRLFVWGEGVQSAAGGDVADAAAVARVYAGYGIWQGKLAGGFYTDATLVGKEETGFGFGGRIETSWNAFFFEIAYGRFSEQFEKRAIVSRGGSQLGFMLGLRGELAGNVFVESGVEQSTKTYEVEDGDRIDGSLSRSQVAPRIGIDLILGVK